MSFPLVHFNLHLFLKSTNGVNFDVFSRYNPPYNSAIDMSYSFSKDTTPSDTSIIIHGLTKSHAKLFTKGSTVTVYAGWTNSNGSENNYHEIFSEQIVHDANTTNSGGDIQTSFTCADGLNDSKTASDKRAKASRSRSIRENASDNTSDREQIRAVKKLFSGKGISLSKFLKNKNELLKSAKSKIKSQRDAIEFKRHKLDKYYKDADRALKGKRKSGASAKRAKLRREQSESEAELRLSDNNLSELSNDLKAKSKGLRTYGKQRRRIIKKAKQHRITRVRGKFERKRRAKSRRKAKSIKHKNGTHFKKGTRASVIISNLARQAHIKIAKLNLVHDKRYTAGYTVDKSPRQCIQDVVRDCDSDIWFEHGQRVIGNFANHRPLNFTLTQDTGLTAPPQEQEDDNSGSSNVPTYSVSCIFLPFVTAGSEFKIIDPVRPLIDDIDNKEPVNKGDNFDGMAVVLSGESDVNSGDTPTTNLTVVKSSQMQKYEQSNNNKRNKQLKIKSRKDARSRKHIKAKRHARQRAWVKRKR